MQTRLVDIGNTQGVLLPKSVVQQAQLTDELDVEVRNNSILIRSVRQPRDEWEEAAIACNRAGEDRLWE